VKPPVEAAASIVGGLVMGTLAWRTKSIWWGVGVHVAVATVMDLMSLGHKGFLW
jgi:membrane protease YdiL (CAAX protease family)